MLSEKIRTPSIEEVRKEKILISDRCKVYSLRVEIQENGIIRDSEGWIVGRCNEDWLKNFNNFNHFKRVEQNNQPQEIFKAPIVN